MACVELATGSVVLLQFPGARKALLNSFGGSKLMGQRNRDGGSRQCRRRADVCVV